MYILFGCKLTTLYFQYDCMLQTTIALNPTKITDFARCFASSRTMTTHTRSHIHTQHILYILFNILIKTSAPLTTTRQRVEQNQSGRSVYSVKSSRTHRTPVLLILKYSQKFALKNRHSHYICVYDIWRENIHSEVHIRQAPNKFFFFSICATCVIAKRTNIHGFEISIEMIERERVCVSKCWTLWGR